MEDYWHVENWHGGLLACEKLAWRTIGIDFLNYYGVSYLITLFIYFHT